MEAAERSTCGAVGGEDHDRVPDRGDEVQEALHRLGHVAGGVHVAAVAAVAATGHRRRAGGGGGCCGP